MGYGPSPPRLFRDLRPGGCRLYEGQNYVESPVIQRGMRHVGHGGRLRSASEGVVVVRRWPEILYPAAPSRLYEKPPLGLRFGLLSPVPSQACARPVAHSLHPRHHRSTTTTAINARNARNVRPPRKHRSSLCRITPPSPSSHPPNSIACSPAYTRFHLPLRPSRRMRDIAHLPSAPYSVAVQLLSLPY